jgi:hypothetical protein
MGDMQTSETLDQVEPSTIGDCLAESSGLTPKELDAIDPTSTFEGQEPTPGKLESGIVNENSESSGKDHNLVCGAVQRYR